MESTKICVKCGKDIPAQFVYCPFCGTDQSKKICKKCGAVLLDDAVFCGICGERYKSDEPAVDAVAPFFVETEAQCKTGTCTSCQTEDFAMQEGVAVAEKTKADEVSLKNKKRVKHREVDKNKILSITKSIVILVFCTIMFALAFCPTMKAKIYFDFDVRGGGKLNCLSTVDGIKLMNATARHYKKGNDDVKIEKLNNDYNEILDDCYSSILNGYNEKTDRLDIDNDTEKKIRKTIVATQAYVLSFDEESGSVESNNAIVFGLTSLLYILFASAMLICAILNVISTFTKKVKNIENFVYALPLFLFFVLGLSYVSNVFNKNANYFSADYIFGEVTASGALIAAMLFSVMAIVAIIVIDAIKKIKSGYSLRKQAIKFLPVAAILIVCGCLFAPCAKSTLVARTSLTESSEYTNDLYSDFTMLSVLSNAEKENRKEFFKGKTIYDEFDYYTTEVEKNNNSLIEYLNMATSVLHNTSSCRNMARAYSIENIRYGLLAQARPEATAALAFGYYAGFLIILLSGAWVCAYLSDTEKYNATSKALQAFIGILLIIALALSIATIYIVNASMKTAEITYFSMSIGGGQIAALVMFVAFAIAAGLISGRYNDKKQTRNPIEQ